jgi:hypothetical protein
MRTIVEFVLKKIDLVPILLALSLCPFTLIAQDGLFSDGHSVEAKELHAEAQPVFLTEANDFIFFLRARYGLSTYRDVNLKLGLLNSNVYFGAHAEEPFLESKEYALLTYIQYGIQYWEDFGLKASYNIRYAYNDFTFYTGLLYQPTFGQIIRHPLMIPIGFTYDPKEFDGRLVFELNGGLNEDAKAFQSVQIGLKMPISRSF